MARSALTQSSKTAILVQEGLRRVRNNCLESDFITNINTLREFNLALKNSGYSELYRLQVTDKIVHKYMLQLDSHTSGRVPFYRNRTERNEYKSSVGHKNKTQWFRKAGYSAVLEVPSTPQGILSRMVKESMNNIELPNNMKIMIKEINGKTLNSLVNNSYNPSPSTLCTRLNCFPCEGNTTKKENCWSENINYEITCNDCQKDGRRAVYIGESGRSTYSRGLEHKNDLETGKNNTPLVEHNSTFHTGSKMTSKSFTMKKTASQRNILSRLVREGIEIEGELQSRKSGENVVLMNKKTDWGQPSLIKIKATNINENL